MEIATLINSPLALASVSFGAIVFILLVLVCVNLIACKNVLKKCYKELDQQTNLLKSQDEYLEGLDLWMQYFSDHLIKKIKIPKSGHQDKVTGLKEAPASVVKEKD